MPQWVNLTQTLRDKIIKDAEKRLTANTLGATLQTAICVLWDFAQCAAPSGKRARAYDGDRSESAEGALREARGEAGVSCLRRDLAGH